MKITFHGAARTVTGSKHLLRLNNGRQILLDCGMFQGMGKETDELNRTWGFEPSEVNLVVISHAHVDHVGLLPKLVKDGYRGPIYCTPQTAEVAELLMLDSAHIMESDAIHANVIRKKQNRELIEPLYTEEDAKRVPELFVTVPYNEHKQIDENVDLLYTDCGHILGSAAINLTIRDNGKTTHLTFSGDVGRYGDLILRSPEPFPQADYIIIESTYGNKRHDVQSASADQLLQHIVHTCLQKKGNLIIPSFSVGRTQELLYLLNQLDNEKRLPPLDYFVDSPLSVHATEIVKHHPECFNKRVSDLLKTDHDVFSFPGLTYVVEAEESKRLAERVEPCVIISASGMAEAGRVKHHIVNNISNHRNTILLVGYCEPTSLGARLKRGDKEVSIYGEKYDVLAETEHIDSLSAHGDYEDLCQWLSCQRPEDVKKLILVHGEYEVQQEFRDRLMHKGFKEVIIPKLHEMVGLND